MSLIQKQHYRKAKHWVKTRVPMHYKVAAVAWMSRLIAGGAQLVSVAIILRYLGTHFYALFALMTGLQGWFGLSDFGLGPSVQNAISKARVQQKDITPILSNAFILLFIVMVGLLFVYSIISVFLQQIMFKKLDAALAYSHYELFIVLGAIYIFTYIWNVIYRILLATRRGHLAYIYQGLGPILSLIAIVTVQFFPFHATFRLLAILIAWIMPPALITAISAVCYFPFKRIKFYWDPLLAHALLRDAMRFFVLSITGVFVTSIDYVVMSQTVSTSQIAIYNILSKGYGILYFVYTAMLTALWPEVAELFAQKQWLKANQLLKRALVLGACFLLAATFLIIVFKNFIILILAPHSGLVLPTSSILWFGFYYVTMVWTATYSIALQSQNHLRVFWPVMSLLAVMSILGSYYCSIMFGIDGILAGLTLALLLTTTWALPIAYWRRKAFYMGNHLNFD